MYEPSQTRARSKVNDAFPGDKVGQECAAILCFRVSGFRPLISRPHLFCSPLFGWQKINIGNGGLDHTATRDDRRALLWADNLFRRLLWEVID